MDRLKEYRAEQIADEAEKRLSMTNDTSSPENGVTTNYDAANDTREQLEADIRKCITSFGRTLMYPDSANKTTEIITTTVDTIFGWLDRQEAITVDECFVQSKTGADSLVLWENCRLREQLDEMERTHMRLPVDADGVPIRVGDRMHYEKYDQTFTVKAIVYSNGLVYVKDAVNGSTWKPDECRHVQPDTVESVLEDFIEAFDKWDNECNHDREEQRDKLFADYAERIRTVVNK